VSPRDLSEGVAAVAPAPGSGPKPSLFLLVAMTGLGPFTMQIVIPSMPVMAAALAVPYGTVQLTLTLYLIGVAVGQLSTGRCRTATGGSRCCWWGWGSTCWARRRRPWRPRPAR
jgi:MFS family permease